MIKRILFATAVLLTFFLAADACSWDNPIWPKAKDSDTPLFRFVVDGKAGFIDASGKIVIAAQLRVFGNAGYDDFFEGIASMSILRSAFIDEQGHAVTFAPYEVSTVAHFAEGLIPATVVSGRERKVGFLDHNRKLAIEAHFHGAGNFSGNLAAVRIGAKWGYADRNGIIAIPPRFVLAERFSGGAARVIADGPCNFVGYGPCSAVNPSVLGLAEYKDGFDQQYGRCQYSFIDRAGAPLFPERFPDAFDFAEGLAAVSNGRRWGFVDRTGAIKITLQFEQVASFSEGLARYRQGNKWGFINATGRIVIPAQYEYADDFSAGAAVVGKMFEKVWFIDKDRAKTLQP